MVRRMASITLPSGFLTSPAALTAGHEAINLHLRALIWSNEHGVSEIPAEALPMLAGRSDARDVALRLVGAGLWAQTATGWAIVQQRREVSEAKARAGRLGGLRSGAVRAKRSANEAERSTVLPASEAPAAVPDTTYARASDSEGSEGSEPRRETTPNPSTPTTTERKVAVVPLSLDPEAERIRALFVEAAGEHFVPAVHGPMRDEFARRLASMPIRLPPKAKGRGM